MEKKFNYVYLTTNLINGHQYVGDRSCDCDPNNDTKYIGSGRPYLQNAIREYGKDNFKKEILEYFSTKQDAFEAQEKYIIKYDTLAPNGYNLSPKGGLNVRGCHSDETKEKIKISNINKHNEKKGKSFEELYGEEKAKEIRAKISKSHDGKKHTDDSRKKMSESKKGKPAWNKNKKASNETIIKIKIARKKQSEQNGEYWSGKKRSEETKLKISNTLKHKNDKFNI